MKPLNDAIRELLKWGTPSCGVLCAILGAIAGVMVVCMGFWNTVLVALFAFIGAFIGGVKNKPAAIKRFLNRVIPSKDDN